MPARNPDTLGRFWSKVNVREADECWPWRSDVDTYGRFNILRGGRLIGSHVFSWILANGEDVPPGLQVLHSCDNKRCVNPTHLSAGTPRQNTKEAVERGLLDPSLARSAIQRKTHCLRGHELTDDNVYVTGSQRRCKTCHAMRAKRYRPKYNETRRQLRARKREEMSHNGSPNEHTQLWV